MKFHILLALALLIGFASGAEPKISTDQIAIDQYVTPEMYGAVGDGTANDTAAVQAALDASLNMIYGKPGSTYLIDGVHLNSYDVFDLRGSVLKLNTTSSIAVWVGENASQRDCGVKNGKIEVTAASQTAIKINNSAFETQWSDLMLYGPAIPYANSIGIDLSTTWINTFSNVKVCLFDTGVKIGSAANDNNFVACSSRSSTTSSDCLVNATGGTNNKFLGGDLETSNTLVKNSGSKNLYFSGVYFEASNSGYMANLTAEDTAFVGCYINDVIIEVRSNANVSVIGSSIDGTATNSGWPLVMPTDDSTCRITLIGNVLDESAGCVYRPLQCAPNGGAWTSKTNKDIVVVEGGYQPWYDVDTTTMKTSHYLATDVFIQGDVSYLTGTDRT